MCISEQFFAVKDLMSKIKGKEVVPIRHQALQGLRRPNEGQNDFFCSFVSFIPCWQGNPNFVTLGDDQDDRIVNAMIQVAKKPYTGNNDVYTMTFM